MKKTLFPLLLFLCTVSAFAQIKNLRKAILKSDLIISTRNYNIDIVWINDFTSKVFINFDEINEGNSWIYKNNLGSIPKKLSLKKMIDGEDFYSYIITDGGLCALPAKVGEYGKTYHDLFFVKKEKNEYKIVAHYQSLEWEQLQKMEQQIKSLASVEKTKNENERYTKTLDWFIENGLMPDDDFVDYYKEKNVIKDSIIYNESQYAKALQEFQDGKEALLPMVRRKHFKEVKAYYLQKMEEITKISEPDYYNYRTFSEAVDNVTNNFNNESESVDYLLNNALTGDKFERYEKSYIMKHLIELVKNLELENN